MHDAHCPVPDPAIVHGRDVLEKDEPVRGVLLQRIADAMVRTGALTLDQARDAARVLAERMRVDEAAAVGGVERTWERCLAEQEAWTDEGDAARLDLALTALRSAGWATRAAVDCCRDTGLGPVETEHAPGDKFYAVYGVQELVGAVGGGTLTISFSYLDDASTHVLTPELHALASAGDLEARRTWMANLDELERLSGSGIVHALRRVGLTVRWGGTGGDIIEVDLPDWRRRLPVG